METITILDENGIRREVDFQGDTLPNGRSIQGILDENEKFKTNIFDLKNQEETLNNRVIQLRQEVKDKSSIITKIIPWKWLRYMIEIILFLLAIYGIILIFI